MIYVFALIYKVYSPLWERKLKKGCKTLQPFLLGFKMSTFLVKKMDKLIILTLVSQMF
jgi:hypothetical protein